MSGEAPLPPPGAMASPPPRRAWLIAGIVVLALVLAYWFLLRTQYVPVLRNVAAQDAADIVKVLDERKLPYRLADGGQTIEVASADADKARIELVGSELPMRGQVGFELFNQSDMGLTEFAQKINYQRALQGELARTILLLDGIRSVRVHLGLPERTVFRDEQAQPKASVTVILQPGAILTEATVDGIQRMVAGAIPEMQAGGVSVLDGTGRVVSRAALAAGDQPSGSDAVLDDYRRRIDAAIARDHPGFRYGLNISLRGLAAAPDSSSTPEAGETAEAATAGQDRPAPRGNPDFAVNVRLTTPAPLDESMRLELLQSIRSIIGLDRARGDSIQFLTGAIIAPPIEGQSAAVTDRIVAKAPVPASTGNGPVWLAFWPGLVAVILVLLLAAWANDRRRARKSARGSLASFAGQLRERLGVGESMPA